MFTYGPVWPTGYIVLYFVASFVTLVLCLVICIAIARTRKTPYASRILCIGLLCYNCLFLPCACASKLFPHQESFPLRHLSRGFQIAAQFMVASMAFERFFVLNWPYLYLKIPKRQVRKTCLGMIAMSFIQHLLVRGISCYARRRFLDCRDVTYFIVLCLLALISLFAIFVQIYTVLRRKVLAVKQYKTTIPNFLYLVNCTVFMGFYLGITLYGLYSWANNEPLNGRRSQLSDAVYIPKCIIDALIYGLWFKEVRMETMKIISVVFPGVKPYIGKMRAELYVTAYELKEKDNLKQSKE